jgi:hypothetical protein
VFGEVQGAQEMTNPLPEEIRRALQTHDLLAITSGITDLREAEQLLESVMPGRWKRMEWGMGSAENRARFHELQHSTGFGRLPMFIGQEGLIGGLPELRTYLQAPPQASPQTSLQVSPQDRLLGALGYAGWIPFFFCALVSFHPDEVWHRFALQALIGYAAVILAFLGAIHWGLYLADARYRVLGLPAPLWAVAPAIAAWAVAQLPIAWALGGLVLLLVVVLGVDRSVWQPRTRAMVSPAAVRFTTPPGYLRMRGYLTLGASLSLSLGLLSLWMR